MIQHQSGPKEGEAVLPPVSILASFTLSLCVGWATHQDWWEWACVRSKGLIFCLISPVCPGIHFGTSDGCSGLHCCSIKVLPQSPIKIYFVCVLDKKSIQKKSRQFPRGTFLFVFNDFGAWRFNIYLPSPPSPGPPTLELAWERAWRVERQWLIFLSRVS